MDVNKAAFGIRWGGAIFAGIIIIGLGASQYAEGYKTMGTVAMVIGFLASVLMFGLGLNFVRKTKVRKTKKGRQNEDSLSF